MAMLNNQRVYRSCIHLITPTARLVQDCWNAWDRCGWWQPSIRVSTRPPLLGPDGLPCIHAEEGNREPAKAVEAPKGWTLGKLWSKFHQKTLVGGLEHFFIFPDIGNNSPNWRTHIFQRGWNHQPEHVGHVSLFLYLFGGLCKRKRSSKPSTQAVVNRILNESNKILLEQFVL